MIVKFEMNLPEDNYNYEVFKNVYKMKDALFRLDNFLRGIRKGWVEPTREEIIEEMEDILDESNYHTILDVE